jgi:hypothetical protein
MFKPWRHVGIVRLIFHPSPAHRIEWSIFRELGQVKTPVEQLHHEGVVERRVLQKV